MLPAHSHIKIKTVKQTILKATQDTALAVRNLILEKNFSPQDVLTEEESRLRERQIDQTGVDAMAASLEDAPFKIEIVGSEGKKHIFDYGEVMPTFEGVVGKGDYTISMVNDVVEGSKAAKLNIPGAISVIAVSTHQGLMPTPPEISYLDKLFGPPKLKGKISIDKPISENLKTASDIFGAKPNVVMMDRERNARYIEAVQRFGANAILIKAGDFMPGILSFIDKKHYLLMGIGGFEEGIMAACAAKALGAVAEGRCWDPKEETGNKYKKTLQIDDLVPGKVEDCFVSISLITDDNKWFNLKAGTSIIISKEGIGWI